MAVMDQVQLADLAALYNTDYYGKDRERYVNVTTKNKKTWFRRLELLEGYQKGHHRLGKKILDVGCGTGAFLATAQEEGWDVWGIEVSKEGTVEAGKKVGFDRIMSDVFALTESEGFDVVTMWAVLEHLIDPVSYLKKAYSLLKPNGLLALATINTDAWNRKLFASKWRYFTPPEHLVYFNTLNLAQTLCDQGFEVLYVATRFNDYAFWQGIGVDGYLCSHKLLRRLGRVVLLPIQLAARSLKRGDIIELIARRAQTD